MNMTTHAKLDTESLERRVEGLEIALAHQSETIEDLNKVMHAQWKLIDGLTRQMTSLIDRVQEAESRTGLGGAAEPPPPHY
jgi:SlyX protein